jgi:hypothetical protein
MKRLALLAAITFAGLVAGDDKKDVVVDLDGMKAKAPPAWVAEEIPDDLRNFRYKQFRLPKAEGDKDDAELVISKGKFGKTEDNLKRWKDTFVPPEGKKIDDIVKQSKVKIGDFDAVMLELEGTYKGREKPSDPSSKLVLKPDYRFTGIILDTKNETFYFKFTGPAKTFEKHEKDFKDWLQRFK